MISIKEPTPVLIDTKEFYLYEFDDDKGHLSVVKKHLHRDRDIEYAEVIKGAGIYSNDTGILYAFEEKYVIELITPEKHPQYFI